MADPRVLLIGAGGVGAPAALALAVTGGVTVVVVDDDTVELSNLHRQILFGEDDVGRPKLDALRDALARRGLTRVELRPGRVTPTTARELVADADVVLDGTDNFATRFLVADAARLELRPVVHAAAVRWQATCFVSGSGAGGPCYRCLFEDLPEGPAPDCAGAGVVGPVCGVIGGIAADAVLRVLEGDRSIRGTMTTLDGRTGRLRRIPVRARPACSLCGAEPTIRGIDGARYATATCDRV